MTETSIAKPAALVGVAYIKRGLESRKEYEVHRTAVKAAMLRAKFPDPVWSSAERIELGHAERLFYRFEVDVWFDSEDFDVFEPRPVDDGKQAFGGHRRPPVDPIL